MDDFKFKFKYSNKNSYNDCVSDKVCNGCFSVG